MIDLVMQLHLIACVLQKLLLGLRQYQILPAVMDRDPHRVLSQPMLQLGAAGFQKILLLGTASLHQQPILILLNALPDLPRSHPVFVCQIFQVQALRP